MKSGPSKGKAAQGPNSASRPKGREQAAEDANRATMPDIDAAEMSGPGSSVAGAAATLAVLSGLLKPEMGQANAFDNIDAQSDGEGDTSDVNMTTPPPVSLPKHQSVEDATIANTADAAVSGPDPIGTPVGAVDEAPVTDPFIQPDRDGAAPATLRSPHVSQEKPAVAEEPDSASQAVIEFDDTTGSDFSDPDTSTTLPRPGAPKITVTSHATEAQTDHPPVATISAADPGQVDVTYQIVDADGLPIDHPIFEIVGNEIVIRSGVTADFEDASVHDLSVVAITAGGQSDPVVVTIDVDDVAEIIALGDAGETFIDTGVTETSVTGGAGADTITGSGGDDLLSGAGGDDTLAGGDGVDRVTWSGDLAGFDVAFDPSTQTFTITDTVGGDGADTVKGVEIFTFNGTDYTATEMQTEADRQANTAPGAASVASGGDVDENAAAGTVVATLTATDVDGDTLTYEITDASGNPVTDSNFEIVGNEIRIKPGADVDFEDATSHDLYIMASDDFESSTPQQITVTVNDVAEVITLADGGATFTDTGVTETAVLGGSGDDQITGSAGDDDISARAGDDQITGGAGDDQIAGGTGNDTAVFTGDLADFTVVYDVSTETFTVTDTTGTEGSDTVTGVETFTFNGTDYTATEMQTEADRQANTAPGAASVASGGDVDENAAAGTVVATLTATDVDGDTLSYQITDASGNPVTDSNFEIVGNEIRIKPGADVDFEDATSHDLYIMASDDFESSTPQQITVTVNDVAEAIQLGDGGETFTDTGVTETSITGGAGDDTLIGGAGDDVIAGDANDVVILMNFNDGASGTAADNSGNGHSGIYQMGAASGGTTLILDGDDDYFEIPNDAAFETPEGTISLRFNANTVEQAGLISRDSTGFDGGGHFHSELLADGSISVRMQSDSGNHTIITSPELITAGEWHQMTVTFGSDGMKLYVDGVLEASGAFTGGIDGNSEPFVLGASQGYSSDGVADNLGLHFDGQMDEFALHDRALDAAEIAANIADGIPLPTDSDDLIEAGAGDDTINAGAGHDTVYGADGDDTITGGEGDDYIDGGADNDSIDAGAGTDTTTGGAGDDTITGGAGDDNIDGGDGADTAIWSGDLADYAVSYDAGSSTFTITDNTGTDGSDTVTGVETFTFNGTDYTATEMQTEADRQANTAPGAASVASGGDVDENAAAGTVVATLTATDVDGDTLSYQITDASGNPVTDSNFEIVGNEIRIKPGADVDFEDATSHDLYIVASDDFESGTPQQITLTVNDVAETITLSDDGVTFVDTGVTENFINGGRGSDTIIGTDERDVIKGGEVESDTLYGRGGDDKLYAEWGGGWGQTVTNSLYGESGNDQLFGANGDDLLDGGTGNDNFYGRGGDDTIEGGEGTDKAVWVGDLEGFAVSYDSDTDTFTITDQDTADGHYASNIASGTGNSYDEGSDTVTGVETFTFNGTDYTAAEMQTEADRQANTAPGVASVASGGDVDENAAAGTVVATLTATDVDGDTLSYQITDASGNPVTDSNFEIVGNEIRIKPGSDLDFEDSTSHDIFITASDDFEASSPEAITVTVNDVAETITLGDGGEIFTDTGVIETSVTGGAGDDTITGSTGDDVLVGDSAANLVVNGSFEDVSGGAPQVWGVEKPTISGWVEADGHNFELVSSGTDGLDASDGDYWLDMFGWQDAMDISQTIGAVQDGDTYALSFDAGVQDATVNGDLEVYFGGQLVGAISPSTPDVMESFTFDLVGGSGDGSNTLRFVETGGGAGRGTGLDNVQIVAAGDDTLDGGAGDDVITGGDGADTAIWSGDLADYAVSYDAGTSTFTITDQSGAGTDEGSDTVTGVETFTFNGTDYTATEMQTEADRQANTAPGAASVASGGDVDENAAAGTVVATLTATDVDGDTLSYQITDASGNPVTDSNFEIVGNEIRIKPGADVDFEDATSHDLYIMASDDFESSTPQQITVTVNDVAEAIQLGDGGETFTDTGVTETSVTGGGGADTITGSAGDDLLKGANGNNVLYGDGGADELVGGDDADTFYGGEGDDLLRAGGGNDTVYGNEGADDIRGGKGSDTLYGGDGDDVIHAQFDVTADETDANTLDGGSGDDLLMGAAGDDTLYGGDDDDSLTGSAGDDTIDGGDGADTAIWSGDLADFAVSYDAGSSTFTITDNTGTDGGDTVTGVETFTFNGTDYTATEMQTEADRQANTAPGAASVASGGDVDENAAAGTVVATLTATDVDGDTLSYEITDASGNPVTDSNFEIVGNEIRIKPGADVDFEDATSHDLYIMASDDFESSTPQQVTVTVNDVAEVITLADGGATFTDTGVTETAVLGGSGDDQITGSAGDDDISARAGDDQITGGAGDDQIAGGTGNDTAVFTGDLADFTVIYDVSTETFTVTDTTGTEGNDTVTGVETFTFNGTDYTAAEMQTEADRQANTAPGAASVASGGDVDENAAAGTVVATLTATDVDGDTLSYEITDASGNPVTDSNFEIVGNEIRIKPGADVDFEDATSHDLYIMASDDFESSTPQQVTVTVNDVAEVITLADGGATFTDTGVTETAVLGGSGDDQITGSAGDDDISARAGDDQITGGAGDDQIAGGTGNDTAVFTGDLADFTVIYDVSTETFTVTDTTGTEGSDTVTGVETFTFNGTDYTAAEMQTEADRQANTAPGAPAMANLTVNGGFEDGLSNWTASGGSVDTSSTGPWGGGASEGTEWAVFGGGNQAGGQIEQSFATIVGETYTLSFDYGANFASNEQTMNVRVVGAGEVLNESVIDYGSYPISYDTFTFTFTADSTSTTLIFDDQSATTGSTDGNLDAVSVTLAPDVEENSATGTVVTILEAEDVDGDTLTFTLTDAGGNPVTDSNFEIVGNEIRVKAGADIDYETDETLTVHVVANDGFEDGAVTQIDIAISDVAEVIQLGDGGVTFTDTGVTETSVTGGAGDDTLNGGAGDDVITGGAGDDVIAGGDGADTAIWSGDLADYAIGYDADSGTFTITDTIGTDGTDTVTGVETFIFNGVSYTQTDLQTDAGVTPSDVTFSPVDGVNSRATSIFTGEVAVSGNNASVDHWDLTHSGGYLKLDVLAYGFDGSPLDSTIYIISDNGDGSYSYVAYNDDGPAGDDGSTSSYDSFIELSDLAAGHYILAVGGYPLSFEEASSSSSDYPNLDSGARGPYQITMIGDTEVTGFSANPQVGGDWGNLTDAATIVSETPLIMAGDEVASVTDVIDADNPDGHTYSIVGGSTAFDINEITGAITLKAGYDPTEITQEDIVIRVTDTDGLPYDETLNIVIGTNAPQPVVIDASNYADTSNGYTVTAQNIEGGQLSDASVSNVGTYGGAAFGANGTSGDDDDGGDTQIAYDETTGLSENVTVALDEGVTSLTFSYQDLYTDGSYEEGTWTAYNGGTIIGTGTFSEDAVGSGSGTQTIDGIGLFDSVTFTANQETDGTGASDFGLTSITYQSSGPGAILTGTAQNDIIYGISGDDTLQGNAGDDILSAGGGDDVLYGGDGDDQLYGGRGDDVMQGGDGNDVYLIAGVDGHDVISDSPGWTDIINLQGVGGVDGVSGNTVDGDGWTLVITSGSVTGQSADQLDLSEQAHGVLTFDTGGTIDFAGIEGITW